MVIRLLAWWRRRSRPRFGRNTQRDVSHAVRDFRSSFGRGNGERLARAAGVLSGVLERYPDDPEVRLLRAMAREHQALQAMGCGSAAPQEWVQALEDFGRIAPGEVGHDEAVLGKALLYVAAGIDLKRRGERAPQPFMKALTELSTADPAACTAAPFVYLEALSHLALGRHSDALKSLGRIRLPQWPTAVSGSGLRG